MFFVIKWITRGTMEGVNIMTSLIRNPDVLFLTVSAKIIPGTVASVAAGGARLPGARSRVFAGVQRARFSAVGAIVTCREIQPMTMNCCALES